MSARPTIIVTTDAPDGPMAVLAETHPDLTVLGCDSYKALPGMISDTGAEVVFTIKFDRGLRYPRAALVESPTVRWVSVGGLYAAGLAMSNPIGTRAECAGTTLGPNMTWGFIAAETVLHQNR
ncbi:hypothetical protein [Mesorhizobium silamurunense]|uniref:hypothetical protein n=1 Tax=Mesorhizobium silamurunense TaxID=499528 RepID=UPI00177B2810|nr:hypothetical protein [Mesorhizobium silamurunense]